MLKASLIGNIGADPDLKFNADGSGRLQMNVASNYRVRGQDGAWADKTEWVRVTVFGKRAESLANLLRKGMRVFADGRLEARPWTDNQGGLRAGLEMIAMDVEFMSPRTDDDGYSRPTNTVNAQRQAVPAGADDDSDLENLPF